MSLADPASVLEFDAVAVRALFAELTQIHLVAIVPDGYTHGRDFSCDVDAAIAWAAEQNAAGLNIHWTVNAVKAGVHKKPSKKEGDIVAARFAHLDLDPPKDGSPWDPAALRAKLTAHACPPSFIGNSGNGLQAFWRLAEPVENWEHVETINADLLALFGGDKGTWNIDRLMRVPGTVNWPDAKKRARGCVPVLAHWLSADDGVCYAVEELAAAFRFEAKPDGGADERQNNGPSFDHDADFKLLTPDDLGLGPLSPIRSAILHPPGRDRSGDGLALARLMANAGHGNAQILGVLLNPTNPVSTHFLAQRDPRRAAIRVVEFVRRNPTTGGTTDPQSPAPVEPVDLWARYEPCPLPTGLLPTTIEQFAFQQGRMMGADPGGLAMASLAVCAAAIPDRIAVQVKEHDPHWRESARLWVALIGTPSSKKSPIMNMAMRPLSRIDAHLFGEYMAKLNEHNALPASERKMSTPPPQRRLRLSDATVEAAQEVLKDSPDGVLSHQDELSGWFGAMDKYAGGKAAMADRGFWLQAYNGGPYALNRVARGAALIPNLSVSILGGIQPEPLRRIVNECADDGLIQRLIPVPLGPASVGVDAPGCTAVGHYDELVGRLWRLEIGRGDGIPSLSDLTGPPLRFSAEAQEVRRDLERRHFDMMQAELISPKMASHFGKYDGMFARLCVVWHCIEHANHADLPREISERTARRVAEFLHSYIQPNAVAFYVGTLGLADDHETLIELASYILAKRLERVQARDIQRASRTLQSLTADQSRLLCEKLESLGWLEPIDPPTKSRTPHWAVNPLVHTMFAERGKADAERRERAREAIRNVFAA